MHSCLYISVKSFLPLFFHGTLTPTRKGRVATRKRACIVRFSDWD